MIGAVRISTIGVLSGDCDLRTHSRFLMALLTSHY
jgi:hypothetical protein